MMKTTAASGGYCKSQPADKADRAGRGDKAEGVHAEPEHPAAQAQAQDARWRPCQPVHQAAQSPLP